MPPVHLSCEHKARPASASRFGMSSREVVTYGQAGRALSGVEAIIARGAFHLPLPRLVPGALATQLRH